MKHFRHQETPFHFLVLKAHRALVSLPLQLWRWSKRIYRSMGFRVNTLSARLTWCVVTAREIFIKTRKVIILYQRPVANAGLTPKSARKTWSSQVFYAPTYRWRHRQLCQVVTEWHESLVRVQGVQSSQLFYWQVDRFRRRRFEDFGQKRFQLSQFQQLWIRNSRFTHRTSASCRVFVCHARDLLPWSASRAGRAVFSRFPAPWSRRACCSAVPWTGGSSSRPGLCKHRKWPRCVNWFKQCDDCSGCLIPRNGNTQLQPVETYFKILTQQTNFINLDSASLE